MTSRFDTPMRRHHVPALMQRPSIDNQRVTSDFWPPPMRFRELPSHRSITAYTWRPPAPSASCKIWQRLLLHKQVCHESERLTGRGGEGGSLQEPFTRSQRLSPIVAPQRWCSTPMSRTCNFWWVSYWKRHPRELGLKLRSSFHWHCKKACVQ
jgi:hypothetical protein